MIQNYINHIALVVDRSGSMASLAKKVVQVFDNEINYLKVRSKELNQETRVSIYLFGSDVECLVFDMDVMRFDTLKGFYNIAGMTALVDATQKAVTDMRKLPELYGDHAFLVYVITDGEENASRTKSVSSFMNYFTENWTLACLVPNQRGIHEAKKFGFPQEAISIWETSERGLEKVGKEFRSNMETYMSNRAMGIRGTKTFFAQLNTKDLTRENVTSALTVVASSKYDVVINSTPKAIMISDLVSNKIGIYNKGFSYYQLVKKEKIHNGKKLAIQDKKNAKVYIGDDARSLLGLAQGEVYVAPGDFGNWNIFVQSTSVNRNIIPNQQVLVFKSTFNAAY